MIPVLDLRLLLGMPSSLQVLQELIEVFDARERDHRAWIDDLEASLREGRAFKFTTDPHACAFGRWYDGLRTTDLVLQAQLRKIDEPHKRIHRRGAEALQLAADGRVDGALRIAADIRTNELAGTLALFAETKEALRCAHREVIVVMRSASSPLAVVVDGVESVEVLDAVDVSHSVAALLGAQDGVVSGMRTRPRDGQLVMCLDLATRYGDLGALEGHESTQVTSTP